MITHYLKKNTGLMILLVVLAASLLLSSCGIQTTEDVDALKNAQSERDTAILEKANLQSELDKQTQVLKDAETALAEAQKQIVELSEAPTPIPASGFPTLLSGAATVISSLKNADYATLAAATDPAAGLRFTAYPFIDTATDLIFTPSQIAAFASDATVYNWGAFDGTGDPIQLPFAQYNTQFVYSADFETPELIGVNTAIGGGNTTNNLTTAYPGASFVEFHFSGFDPQYEGMDWQSLTLVFHQVGGSWYLIGIVHGQWTI